ncbi:MAG: glycosyltransferase family 4 protein [Alphaproteobacteria bacterium]|nr:glycosyltransferase family 4 protein [Alphaproteobacteria bacterium]
MTLSILSLTHDRGLLDASRSSETQIRQLFYCRTLPAHITHLVKSPMGATPTLSFDDLMAVSPCPVPHWSLFFPCVLWHGAKLLHKRRYDFIQAQEPYLAGLAGALLSKMFNVPLVVGLFSDEVDNPEWVGKSPMHKIANGIARWVLRQAKAARADSQAVAERVGKGNYCPVTYIPFLITHADKLMAPNADAAAIRTRLLGEDAGLLLLAVCRLEEEKNLPLMLNAFAEASRHRPDMKLAIAGTGRLEAELRQLGEHIAPGRIIWLGWVDAAEMGGYYQAADLMLLSSTRESAARVLTESLLSGTPVLTTDTAGAREVIEDGVSGRVTPVGDQQAFAQAILDLTADKEKLRHYGQQGKQAMRARMTGPAISAALRDFYKRAAL